MRRAPLHSRCSGVQLARRILPMSCPWSQCGRKKQFEGKLPAHRQDSSTSVDAVESSPSVENNAQGFVAEGWKSPEGHAFCTVGENLGWDIEVTYKIWTLKRCYG
ncbi:hypothetical protein V3C99_002846 [Haemonchus contortus]